MNRTIFSLFLICLLCGCSKKFEQRARVELSTNYGDIQVELYNETPLHKANFLKIVKAGILDSVLFHRVINEFMIQAGDPGSKGVKEGEEIIEKDLGYTIPREFVYPEFFHKRGQLAAARLSDEENPNKASSATQFYIVTGKVFDSESMHKVTVRKTKMLKDEFIREELEKNKDTLQALYEKNDTIRMHKIHNRITREAERISFRFPWKHQNVYEKEGGAPHLDNEYTIFGQVVKGMEVVDSIQHCQTDDNNRPLKNIVLLKARVVRE